ncbi:hypothetical protein E3P99_02934 [Wallemia hederae]|uniref:AmmeMemoRadiSam system protein B n=1 Tax=Wallemia hederae TaxID=1540922 RepID=A0A4T0FM24_9BASI|nr:hypothetical protein E3P99_02934 [Wallemia hederae]
MSTEIEIASYAAAEISAQINDWFKEAEDARVTSVDNCRVIIAPHGESHSSGRTAAFAYSAVNMSQYKRVIILSPYHLQTSTMCCHSRFDAYDTPFGQLRVDNEVNDYLKMFRAVSISRGLLEEDDFSFERQMTFIKKAAKDHDIRVVPIRIGVGFPFQRMEDHVGFHLSRYIKEPDTLFVVSSNFTRWGRCVDDYILKHPYLFPMTISVFDQCGQSNSAYTYYRPSPQAEGRMLNNTNGVDTSKGEALIHESIAGLDYEAWDILKDALSDPHQAHTKWTEYLNKTENTICGRHSVGVLLGALRHANLEYKGEVVLTHYEQSCTATTSVVDCSVSYLAGYMAF